MSELIYANIKTSVNSCLNYRKVIGMDNGLRWNQSTSGVLGTNNIYPRNEGDPIEWCVIIARTELFLLLHYRGRKFFYVTSSNVVSSTGLLTSDLEAFFES